MKACFIFTALLASIAGQRLAEATVKNDPMPGDPLIAMLGQRKPMRVRVARGQATLIRLPDGQRIMNAYGADNCEACLWGIDAGKVPTRFLAVKPREAGIHTTLHVVSDTGQEISFLLQEVTGIDPQFDPEVDVELDKPVGGGAQPDIKWILADESNTLKAANKTLKEQVSAAEDKSKQEVAAAVLAYQASYPSKLHVDYTWDDPERAARLGFVGQPYADEKFTYIQGSRVLALYEVNEDKQPSLIRYGYADGMYKIDKIVYDGYLAIGTKKQNKLTFHRERRKS